jgi:hypothetical protein
LQIQILSVTQVQHPTRTPGKTTPKLDLAYKNLTFGGKVEGKALFSFGDQANAFKALAGANSGDVFEVEVVKNASGFNDWVSVKKSDGTSTAPTASSNGRSAAPAQPVTRSTYETPEERAKKQIYIVRQSSISNAIDALSVGAKTAPAVQDILTTAAQFEEYVFGNSNDVGEDGFKDLDNMDDVPL